MRHRMRFNNHTDLSKGEWLILARTNYMLEEVLNRLKQEGMFYTFKNRSSVSDRLIRAVQGWDRLKEEAVDLQTVKDIYYYISGSGRIQHGYKEKLKQMDPAAMYDYESLTMHHGLNVDINLPWDAALDDVPESMRLYMNVALRRSSFNSASNIRVSTIHASKGSEADNVMLLTDLPRKADISISKKRDDERRVFYVGATRAKKSLHIIASKTDREFTELL
jgi:ATP-dependent exoDNAse (exonuclease V) beta subunit